MRRGLVVLIAVALCSSSAVAAGVRTAARITYVTPKVSAHGVLTLRALVSPETSCAFALLAPHAHAIRLRSQRSRSGRLQWTYRVPEGMLAGDWTAHLSCEGHLEASRTFAVAAPVLKANVVVAKSGFTQSNYSDGSQFISYGVVLNNETSKVDALNVGVSVSFTDTLGRSVATQTTTLTGIPAGGAFYVGGFTSPNVALTAASMNVSVTAGSTQSHRFTLPTVTGLGLQADSDGFGSSVTGTIQNPYSKPIPSLAQIYVVYLNAQGSVIGGASEFANAAVNPGSSTPFSFDSFSSDINSSWIPASDISTIDGSVDPCGAPNSTPLLDASCPAQVPIPAT